MNKRTITVIALRLLAIYIALQFIAQLPTTISYLQMLPHMQEMEMDGATKQINISLPTICFFAVSLLYIVLACFLFFGANRISKMLVKESESKLTISGKVSDQVSTLAFQCLGYLP